MNVIHAEIAKYQKALDATKRELRHAVADLNFDDDALIQLRAEMIALLEKLRELDAQIPRRSL